MNVFSNSVVLARQVATEPGFIVRPIAWLFGWLVNFVFNLVYLIGPVNSLGITIIIVTIVFRAALLPTSIKAQKSMRKMQEIKPELDKIKEKYGNTKDPEKVKKMNAEQSALMAKHDANPLKGCLPMLLQMPLFIGFNFVLQQAFLYIGRLREVYYDLAVAIMRVPDYINIFIPPGLSVDQHRGLPDYHANAIRLLPNSILDNNMQAANLYAQGGWSLDALRAHIGELIDISIPADFARVINRFTADNWAWLQAQIEPYYPHYWADIASLNEYRQSVESFLGINMIEVSGWTVTGIVLSVITGVSMFVASWVGQQRMAGAAQDDRAKMQQRMMLIIMPVVFGFMTVSFPAGLALFWITGQIFQTIADVILMKRAGTPIKLPFLNKKDDE